MALNVMQAYVIDVSSLNFTIKHQARTESMSYHRTNSLVMRTNRRDRKNVAYFKRQDEEQARRNGDGAGPSGTTRYR